MNKQTLAKAEPQTIETKDETKKVLLVGYGVLGKATLNAMVKKTVFQDVELYVYDQKEEYGSLPRGVKKLSPKTVEQGNRAFDVVILCVPTRDAVDWTQQNWLEHNLLFNKETGTLVVRSTLPIEFFTEDVKNKYKNFVYFPEYSTEYWMKKTKNQVYESIFCSSDLAAERMSLINDNMYDRKKPFKEVAAEKLIMNASIAVASTFQNEVNFICREHGIDNIGLQRWLSPRFYDEHEPATPSSMVGGKCLEASVDMVAEVSHTEFWYEVFNQFSDSIRSELREVLKRVEEDTKKKKSNGTKLVSIVGLNNNVMHEDSDYNYSSAKASLEYLKSRTLGRKKFRIALSSVGASKDQIKEAETLSGKLSVDYTNRPDFVIFVQPKKTRMSTIKKFDGGQPIVVFDLVNQFTKENIEQLKKTSPGVTIVKNIWGTK